MYIIITAYNTHAIRIENEIDIRYLFECSLKVKMNSRFV